MTDNADQAPDRGEKANDRGSGSAVSAAVRRRLIKGGLSAGPVILTLTSRPVLGFENACLSPSRMISGNHSGFTGPTTCGGYGRAIYQGQTAQNPPLDWTKLNFAGVFGIAYVEKNATGNSSPDKFEGVFLSSLAGNDGNANSIPGFASYIIAAYLNALNNVGEVSDVLPYTQVVDMWHDVIGTGQYCPQINMCWNATGVVQYFQFSGIVPS